jgi:hypothetical protein
VPVTLPVAGTFNWADTLNAAIQALAAANDAQKLTTIASGIVNVDFANSNTASKVVTFPAGRFSTPPIVTVAAANASIEWIASIGLISANQFTCYVFHRNTTAITQTVAVHWIAVATT